MVIEVLKIVIYLLLAALIIVGIILGIKLINVTNNAQKAVDSVNKKLESLDTLFNVLDATSNKVVSIYSKLIDIVVGATSKFISKKGKDEEEDE